MRLIDADELIEALDSFILDEVTDVHGDTVREILERLPSAQPEPSQVARDIATIIENEQDMMVIERNAQNEAFAIAEFIGKMNRRTFEEMVSYFNQTVADMDIDRKYKMELLGMITAILQRHDEDMKHAREALRKEIWEDGRDRLD